MAFKEYFGDWIKVINKKGLFKIMRCLKIVNPNNFCLPIAENSYKFFQNKSCKYFPCHSNVSEKDFNCMFCYCPLYSKKECGGNYRILENGVKDCSGCVIPHGRNSWGIIQGKLK